MARCRRILITGSSRGLGRALAVGLAGADTEIGVVGRTEADLQQTKSLVQARGSGVLSFRADFSEVESCHRLLDLVYHKWGGVDVLINNVGIWEGKPLSEVSTEEVVNIINVNLTTAILLTQGVLSGMIGRRTGHIVNIGSTVGLYCAARSVVYAATKFGIWGLARAIRPLCRKSGIKVTTIFPGSIASEMEVCEEASAVRQKYDGKRMPSDDLVRVVRIALDLSAMSLIEELAIPAQLDRYGD